MKIARFVVITIVLGVALSPATVKSIGFFDAITTGNFGALVASIPPEAQADASLMQNKDTYTQPLDLLLAIKRLNGQPDRVKSKIILDKNSAGRTALELALAAKNRNVIAFFGLYYRSLDQSISKDLMKKIAQESAPVVYSFLTYVNDMKQEVAKELVADFIKLCPDATTKSPALQQRFTNKINGIIVDKVPQAAASVAIVNGNNGGVNLRSRGLQQQGQRNHNVGGRGQQKQGNKGPDIFKLATTGNWNQVKNRVKNNPAAGKRIDNNGNTPLHLALKNTAPLVALHLLLTYGEHYKITKKNKRNEDFLDAALQGKAARLVVLIALFMQSAGKILNMDDLVAKHPELNGTDWTYPETNGESPAWGTSGVIKKILNMISLMSTKQADGLYKRILSKYTPTDSQVQVRSEFRKEVDAVVNLIVETK